MSMDNNLQESLNRLKLNGSARSTIDGDGKTALVIVDVQNDFVDGSLSVRAGPAHEDPSEFIGRINRVLGKHGPDARSGARFDYVIATQDWHPDNHISFFENTTLRKYRKAGADKKDKKSNGGENLCFETVLFELNDGAKPYKQKLWPRHAVAGTWGAQLHKDLQLPTGFITIYKGTNPEQDSYSAFDPHDDSLLSILKDRGVTDVYTCGFAADICVGHTTIDSIEHGFRTTLLEDCSIAFSRDDAQKKANKIEELGGYVIKSDQLKKALRKN